MHAGVPHDLVQVEYAPHDGTAQSTAHAGALHERVSAECGQALPPFLGAMVARLRSWTPLPQDLLQVAHGLQEPVLQLVGHTKVLQVRVSV